MPSMLWDHRHPGIYIENVVADFFVETSRDLNVLRSKPLGKDLLEIISKRCQGVGTKVVGGRVLIQKSYGTIADALEDTQGAPDDLPKIFRANKVIPGTSIKIAGEGSSSVASYNPDAEQIYSNAVGIYTPEFVALAHELCHCLHFLSGDLIGNIDFEVARMHEEARTVGAGRYAGSRVSENGIRREWGLPVRTFYEDPGDCDLP